MKRLEIEIPSTLSEITLQQYKRYLKVVEENQEGEYADRFISLKMLEIFCNVPYKVALQLKMSDVGKAVHHLTSLLNSKQELVQEFEIGDTTFGFLPKLDDMTFGEFIDLDTSISDWDKMHKAMAVLYRPIKKRVGKFYNVEEYRGDSYHEAMELTPLDAVFGSLLFFYHLGIELSKLMTSYIQEGSPKAQHLQQVLEESGVGISQFTHSLTEMLEDLNISQQ
jgi:hypothetical protein